MTPPQEEARARRVSRIAELLETPLFIPPSDRRILKFSPFGGNGLLLSEDPILFFPFEVEPPDYLELRVGDPVEELGKLGELMVTSETPYGVLSRLVGTRILDGEPVLKEVLSVPLEGDVRFLESVAERADRALSRAFEELSTGMSRRELEASIQARAWEEGLRCDVVVAIGEESLFPLGPRNDRVVRRGDVLLMRATFEDEGYTIPYVRTVLTERDFEVENKLGMVMQALRDAVSFVSPGYPSAEVRDALVDAHRRFGFSGPAIPASPAGGFSAPAFEPYEVLQRNQVFTLYAAVPARKSLVSWSATVLVSIPVRILDRFGLG